MKTEMAQELGQENQVNINDSYTKLKLIQYKAEIYVVA
jgi:hypothetical protein